MSEQSQQAELGTGAVGYNLFSGVPSLWVWEGNSPETKTSHKLTTQSGPETPEPSQRA